VRARIRAAPDTEVFSLLAMIIIEEVLRNVTVPAGTEPDTIIMGWQERRQTRQRLQSLRGRKFALALETGTVLKDGDILYVGQGFYLAVEAEEEDVLVVPLGDATLAALAAYELGNRHLPVSIGHDRLMTPYDRLMEELLAGVGITCDRRKERFEPARMSHRHG